MGNKYTIQPYVKYAVVLCISLFIILFPSNKKKEMPEIFAPPFLAGDTLSCHIMIDKSLAAKGHPLGYIFDVFGEFTTQQGCEIEFSHETESRLAQWVKLTTGKMDMMIINSQKDSVPEMFQENVISSIPINDNEDVCVVAKDNYKIIQTLNYWLTFFRQTPAFEKMTKKYYRKLKHTLSPYDDYIKTYAAVLGWDWRLLASLMYQESKFKLGLSSSRGAIGLMQIKENIARQYGIVDIYDPESNIKAGVYHLQRLQKRYQEKGADSLDLIKITLAAYNAGEGRIDDCINLAGSLKKPTTEWSALAEVIPLMNEHKHYTSSAVKLGRFRGKETLRFVDEILKRYEKYTLSVE